MDFVLISGMSGAGKATAAKALEETGFLVVDNLPPGLLASMPSELERSGLSERLCVVSDARSGSLVKELCSAVETLQSSNHPVRLLFIDASNEVLVRRFSETRKHHPFGDDDRGILAGIELERSLIEDVKKLADLVLDTSEMKPDELKRRVLESTSDEVDGNGTLAVTLTSFGFKFGLPIDADLVFDVRFLVNPHYERDLRPYDGRNEIIDDFVMKDPAAVPYLDKLVDLLSFSIPHYIAEGKAYLTVAVGCTGGRHRSVVVAERVGTALRSLGYRVVTNHRDVCK